MIVCPQMKQYCARNFNNVIDPLINQIRQQGVGQNLHLYDNYKLFSVFKVKKAKQSGKITFTD